LQAAGSDDLFPPFSRASRAQKLLAPTFHMPFWNTALPRSPDSSAVGVRSVKMTVAGEGDTAVTLVTRALVWAIWTDVAWITEANSGPSCSRLTRCRTGVPGLKKAVQFAAMTFAADGGDGLLLLVQPEAAALTAPAESSRRIFAPSSLTALPGWSRGTAGR
jgi:hypothetical protein